MQKRGRESRTRGSRSLGRMLAVLGMGMRMTRMGILVVLSEEEQEEEGSMVVLAVVAKREARVDKELLVVIGGDMGLCWWSGRGT